jgi:pimeloyl-ACP methyl ester carboxylesterase
MVVTKPTVVFIPGFWHTSEGFGPLATLLQKENYATTLVDLPSAGAHPSHPDYSQDVAAIRKIITDLAHAGEEILLVMHSGGSIAGSDAVKDLSKKEREAEGKKGGVVRMFYIGILLPQAGKTIFETYHSVVTSPDLDPDFVIDPKQEFVVIAEVVCTISRQATLTKFSKGWNFHNHRW